MTTRVAAGLAAWAGIACASVPQVPSGYTFPESFEVTQVVEVDAGRPGSRQFVASLKRVGGDYEVTLFDAVFDSPLLNASAHSGTVTVEARSPGVDARFGYRLVELLRDLYGRNYPPASDGATESTAGAVAVRLAGVPASASACRFPSTIEVIPPLGGGSPLLVRTIDIACAPSRRRQ